MKILLISLAIVILQFIENFLWAMYIDHAAKKKLLRAAIYGEMITVVGAITFYSWLDSKWYIVPTVIGGFLGTYFSDKVKVKVLKKDDS